MKKLAIIGFLTSILCMGLVIKSNAQTPKRVLLESVMPDDGRILTSVVFKEGKDTLGFDYLTPEEFNKEFSDKWDGTIYTDKSGNKYPLFRSVNDKPFIIRVSKNTGKAYRYYLTGKI